MEKEVAKAFKLGLVIFVLTYIMLQGVVLFVDYIINHEL